MPALVNGQRADEQQARDPQHDADQEQPVDRDGPEVDQAERGPVQPGSPAALGCHRWHHLVPVAAQQLGDGDELKPSGVQGFDDPGNGFHGLFAVATGIMQQDYVAFATYRRLHGTPHDFIHARTLPVVRIDLHAHGEVTLIAGQFDRPYLIEGFRFGIHRVWRSKQQGLTPHRAGQQPLGRRQLQLKLSGRNERNIGMGEGVAADFMPSSTSRRSSSGCSSPLTPMMKKVARTPS